MKQIRKWTAFCCYLLWIVVAIPTMAQQVPNGYSLLTDPSISGGHLIASRGGTGSAAELLALGLEEVSIFFHGAPEVIAGFCDLDDRNAQAIFRATIQGRAVGGVAYAVVGNGTGTTGVIFDSPQTIRQSLPRLMGLAGGSSNRAASARNWRDTPFPDGSGWMRLPEGWAITFSDKGMAAAEGPHGIIERGIWSQVMTRTAASQSASIAGISYPGPVFDPIDPVSAMQAFNGYLNIVNQQRGLSPRNILRVIEASPAPLVAGYSQAAYIDYEYETLGRRYRCIQYVMLGDVGPTGVWILYTTYVASPSDTFAQNLPVLIQIWSSSRTAQHVIQGRIEDAIKSLQEAGDIYQQASSARENSLQKMHDQWIEAIQGTRIIEDSLTNERRDIDLGWSKEIVQRMNQNAGYQRYQEIPLWQLNHR